MQGYHLTSTGAYSTSANGICSKNPIPCKSGDEIKIDTEKIYSAINLVWYNESGYMSAKQVTNTATLSHTIPSGATHFNFAVFDTVNGLTPDTVGKITLTINGKYVHCVKGHGKNFLQNKGLKSASVNGLTITKNEDNSVTVIGTATGSYYYTLNDNMRLPADDYIISGSPIGSTTSTSHLWLRRKGETSGVAELGNGTQFHIAESEVWESFVYIRSGATVNATFYPMIRKADILDDTYEPYQETVAYFLTEKPMMADSVLFREDGLFKVEHGSAEDTFSGGDDEVISYNSDREFFIITTKTNIARKTDQSEVHDIHCTHCLAYSYSDLYDAKNSGLLHGMSIRCNGDSQLIYADRTCTSVDDLKAKLQASPMTVRLPRYTPYIEVLDTESQLALHGLKTFDNVTYLGVDSRTKPKEIEVEYGTSQVGAYTLQAMNVAESNAIKLDELAVAMVSLGSEV